MKEMCNDFVESEMDIIMVTPTVKSTTPAKSTNKHARLDDNMAVTDCNTCVLQSIGLAQAFVPFQPNANTMDKEQSLVCGTAFPDLVQPYVKGSNLKSKY